ncbi:MAG: hypothetical protein ACHQFW_02095 [Chitinophagales bacterium]
MKEVNFGKAAPKVELMKQRMQHVMDLTFAKVAAHVNSPANYPLPTKKKSLEVALHDLYKALPKKGQKDFLKKGNEILSAGDAKRKQQFGDLATLDYKSRTPFSEQVKKMPIPQHLICTNEELEDLAKKLHVPKPRKKASTVSPKTQEKTTRGVQRNISLSVEKITCIDTQEKRKDELLLDGFFVDALGETTFINQIDVGKIEQGQEIPLGTKGKIADFDLNAAGIFPQTFTGGFFVIEKDLITNQDIIDKIFFAIGVACGVLSGITLTMLGVAVGLGAAQLYPAAAAVMTAVIVSAIIIGVLLVLGLLISFTVAGDFSNTILDLFTFDIDPLTLQQGESEIHLQDATISGFIKKRTGKYTLEIQWLRTA